MRVWLRLVALVIGASATTGTDRVPPGASDPAGDQAGGHAKGSGAAPTAAEVAATTAAAPASWDVLATPSVTTPESPTAVDSTAPSTSTTVATTTAKPSPVFSLIGGAFYLNLPIDNWSMFGALRTDWRRLRIQGVPSVGHTSIVVDLHDFEFAETSGHVNEFKRKVTRVEWGLAEDCTFDARSNFSVNLVGTPFAYQATYEQAFGGLEASLGVVTCDPQRQHCTASVSGFCAHIGLGSAGSTQSTELKVVDQQQFDHALQSLYDVLWGAIQTETSTTTSSSSTTTMTTTETETETFVTSPTHTATSRTTFEQQVQQRLAARAQLPDPEQQQEALEGGSTGFMVFLLIFMLCIGAGLGAAHYKGLLPGWLDKLKAYAKFQEEPAEGPSYDPPAQNVGLSRVPKPPPMPSWMKQKAGQKLGSDSHV